jgi:hypothetical protein
MVHPPETPLMCTNRSVYPLQLCEQDDERTTTTDMEDVNGYFVVGWWLYGEGCTLACVVCMY